MTRSLAHDSESEIAWGVLVGAVGEGWSVIGELLRKVRTVSPKVTIFEP